LELLRRSSARISGVVLNFAPGPFLSPLAGLEPELHESASVSSTVFCPSCGKSFSGLSACLAETSDEGETAAGSVRSLKRKCSCGCVFVPALDERRDNSPEGESRRKAFGELIGVLRTTGLSLDQARQQLLLTLKVWRSELSADTRAETSAAGLERNRMFQELLDRLVQAGLTLEQARGKIIEAAETWRKAP
jgi:hypothetical protein